MANQERKKPLLDFDNDHFELEKGESKETGTTKSDNLPDDGGTDKSEDDTAVFPDDNITNSAYDTAAISDTDAGDEKNETLDESGSDTVYANVDVNDLWDDFIATLAENDNDKEYERTKGLLTYIDRDICYTLDECPIDRSSRTQKINAILRCFIKAHRQQFSNCRRIRTTLLID